MRLSAYSPTPLQGITLSTHPSVYSKRKRCIDIFGALLGLLVTLILFLPIVLAIRLDTPGPIFYSQQRCGLKGKKFKMLKFRSMVTNADQMKHLVQNEAAGHIFKNRNDPRITKVGRFLRKTSLDELPQFFNVLKGDMSLVGTRPPTSEEVEQYSSFHFQRLNIKPGMTGEWQVYGRSNVENFDAVVRMDLNYQQKWSISYDLSLLLRTIFVVLGGQGAY
ncbi:MAG: sugar transferase [Leptolyngbya sp. SIO3F4]|nr:sugar transferase [Leptolyngbya sp. SIO3F4]